MKKVLCLIAIMTLALTVLESCGPARYTQSGTNLSSVQEFAFIEPYAYMVLYGDDGKGYYNDNDSRRLNRSVSRSQT